MKNQDKSPKYKNKNKLMSNVDNKLNSIFGQFLVRSEFDKPTSKNKIGREKQLSTNVIGDDEIFDLTETGLTEHNSNESSKHVKAQDKHTIIEMVDSDLEITYSSKTKNDTSIVMNDSLSDKPKKKKPFDAVPKTSNKKEKDRKEIKDSSLTDKEDNELFFFDLSGNKVNNSLTEITYFDKTERDTSVTKESKKKKKKRPAIHKEKKKDRFLSTDSHLTDKEDNELFFFDLSGSRPNNNLPQMTTQHNTKHNHFADEENEITYCGIVPMQNESKLGKKKKKKKLKEKELNENRKNLEDVVIVDYPSTKKKKNRLSEQSIEYNTQIQNSVLDLIHLVEDEPPKKKKVKKANSSKESSSQDLFSPKKKKQKLLISEPAEVEDSNTPNVLTHNFSDNTMQIRSEKKKKKKVKLEPEFVNTKADLQQNSIFSDNSSEIPNKKKRKKKDKHKRIQANHVEQSIDFFSSITDYNKEISSEKNEKNKQKSDITTGKKKKKKRNTEDITEIGEILLSQPDDGSLLSSTIEKKKKKSKIKTEALHNSGNENNTKLKGKIEQNQNEYGKTYKTFEDYLNMDQEEDHAVHISTQIPSETVKFIQSYSVNEIDSTDASFSKKSKNKPEMADRKKNRTISEESFNTIIDSIVGDSRSEESFNESLNEKTINYTSTDFNFDTIIDNLMNDLDAEEQKKVSNINHFEEIKDNTSENNDSTLKKSKKKKDKISTPNKHSTDTLVNSDTKEQALNNSQDTDSNIPEKSKNLKYSPIEPNIIEESEKMIVKKKKRKSGEVKKQEVEDSEANDMYVPLNEVLNPLTNIDANILKKSKKKKDKTDLPNEHSSNDLVNNVIDKLYTKKKKQRSKSSQDLIDNLANETKDNSLEIFNNLQDSDSGISKKSNKHMYQNSGNCIEDTENVHVKRKRKRGDVKQEQIEEVIEESEAHYTHISLNELLSLPQNNDGNTLKKSKKKKHKPGSSTEQCSDSLIAEIYVNKKNKASREHFEDLTEENNQNFSQDFNNLHHSDTGIEKKSKKQKIATTDLNLGNTVEENVALHVKSKRKSNENKQQLEELIEESEIYDTHISLNEVLSLPQNSEMATPKKSKKKKNKTCSPIEQSFYSLINNQTEEINNKNKCSQKNRFEDMTEENIHNLSQDSESNILKKSKKQKITTTNLNLDNTTEELNVKNNRKHSDQQKEPIGKLTEESETYERHIPQNEVLSLSQNSDTNTPEKSKKKKNKTEDLTKENFSQVLNHSQDSEYSISKKSKKQKIAMLGLNLGNSLEETEELHVKNKRKHIDEKKEQIENEDSEICDRHVSLDEVLSLSQNSDINAPKKSKKKNRGSQERFEDFTEENNLNFSQALNQSQDSESNILKKSKKQKNTMTDLNLDNTIEETEELNVKNKRKHSYEKKEQIQKLAEESETYEKHVSQNEVLSLSQESDTNTPMKSKKKKNKTGSPIEQSSDNLEEVNSNKKNKGSQERFEDLTEENNSNFLEALNYSQDNESSILKKSNRQKKELTLSNSIEELDVNKRKHNDKKKQQIEKVAEESELYDTYVSLKEVLSLSQNSDGSTPKNTKKKKNVIQTTQNPPIEETVISSPNEIHVSLNEVLNLSQNSDSAISKKSIKKIREETTHMQDTYIETNNVLSQDLFTSCDERQEETLENMQMFLELLKAVPIEETKQDSGFEDSDNLTKSKKKSVRRSCEEKKNFNNIETDQKELEGILNSHSKDTDEERTLKRKKCSDSDEVNQSITKKLKLGGVNTVNDSVNVNINQYSENIKWNVDDVFSDDDDDSNNIKIEKRIFQPRRRATCDGDFVMKRQKIRRTRRLSDPNDSNSDSKLNLTVMDDKLVTDEELEILRNLSVYLPFEDRIPPLHMIQRPSRPTIQDVANAKIMNAKFGAFTKDEDAQIVKNWKRFCKIHDVNIRPYVFFRFRKQWSINNKIKFLQFLSHKLDDRMPFRVHARFKKIFENEVLKKGRYSFDEDRQIIEFMSQTSSPRPYFDLGLLLNRHGQSIERRYAFLTSGKNKTPIKWTTQMAERMVKAMMQIVETDNVKDLEHYTFKDAQWKKLSEMLDDIPQKKLQRAWTVTIHSRLFMKDDKQDIKERLLQLMVDNGEDDFRAISWEKYAKEFKGVTGRKLNDTFRIMCATVPKELKKDLKGTLEYLMLHLSEFGYSRTQFRYRFKNGELVCKAKKPEKHRE